VLSLRASLRAVAGACLVIALDTAALHAQAPGDLRLVTAARQERIGPTHVRYAGAVEIELVAQGIRLSGDVVDYDAARHRLTAEGHVVFVTGTTRVAADRAEVDTLTRTGTFVHASGSATVADKVDRGFFGDQAPDAFFYGETIEKLSADTYRIRKGGFTTCLQPTPRWEVTADAVTLTVDKRAVLKHAVLKVKDVPLFYVPAMYYPINKEDRSTGFLLPVYGTSTIRGSSISNAFFWAINRSQDLTLMHDWFTKTGQGYGGEYRYVASAGSNGEFRMYRLNERATTFQQSGTDITQPARQSFEIRTNVVQALPAGFRARGSVDYFSDVTVQQQYQLDLYNASLRTRNYQGNVSGGLGKGNSLSVTYGIN
jgi:LPS-assembly protein